MDTTLPPPEEECLTLGCKLWPRSIGTIALEELQHNLSMLVVMLLVHLRLKIND